MQNSVPFQFDSVLTTCSHAPCLCVGLSCSHAPCLCMGAVLFTCSMSLHMTVLFTCSVSMHVTVLFTCSVPMHITVLFTCSLSMHMTVLFTCSVPMHGSSHVSLHSVEFSCVVLNFCTFCRSTNFREMSPVTLEDWAIPFYEAIQWSACQKK